MLNLGVNAERFKKVTRKIVLIMVSFLTLGVICIPAYFYSSKQSIKVEGVSMYPTFQDGELAKSNILFNPSDIKHNTVVIDNKKADKYHSKKYRIIKRVFGLPGDTVKVTSDAFYLNGKKIESRYNSSPISNDISNYYKPYLKRDKNGITFEHKLGKNEYFLMGDNRNNSYDSRFTGAVDYSSIYAINPVKVKTKWLQTAKELALVTGGVISVMGVLISSLALKEVKNEKSSFKLSELDSDELEGQSNKNSNSKRD